MDLFVNQGVFQMSTGFTFSPCGLAKRPNWKPNAVIVEVKAIRWPFLRYSTRQQVKAI